MEEEICDKLHEIYKTLEIDVIKESESYFIHLEFYSFDIKINYKYNSGMTFDWNMNQIKRELDIEARNVFDSIVYNFDYIG